MLYLYVLNQFPPLNEKNKTIHTTQRESLVPFYYTNAIQSYTKREYESMLCPIKFFRWLYNACNLLIPTFQCIPNVYTTAAIHFSISIRIYNHDCCQLQPSFVYYLNNTPHDYYRDRYEICVLYELEFNFLNTIDVDSK